MQLGTNEISKLINYMKNERSSPPLSQLPFKLNTNARLKFECNEKICARWLASSSAMCE